MSRLISHSEALQYFGIPAHAQAGFLAAGAADVSEKTIRRVLAGESDPRDTTAARIQRAAVKAYSRLMGFGNAELNAKRASEIRESEEFEWISIYERAVADLIEQEDRLRSTERRSPDAGVTNEELLERIRLTVYLIAGFEAASAKGHANITLYWCDHLPRRDEQEPGKFRMPMWRWFDQVRTQFEKGSLLVGVRESEQKAAISLFDAVRYLAALPQEPEMLPESERAKVSARFLPASSRRVHQERLPYTVVEKELGLAPKQASRWANAGRATDLPGWKALLMINQRMSSLMPPALRKSGPNLPVELMVARFLHAFCLDCLGRGATLSMLERMEPWYAEAAGAWVRYFKAAGKTGGQNPLLAPCPPSP